jgi:hypothetical protein
MGGIIIKNEKISKEEFLKEHNKLSPANLEATMALLNRFREEKKPALKDNEWCIDKHRIPFITWLLALPNKEEMKEEETGKQIYKNYPETHYVS